MTIDGHYPPHHATPTLGVLGGMGPAATADFLQRLAHLTPAERDQDHLPTIVYSDPRTPDRSDAILGTGPSPLPAMQRGIEFLDASGCALVAVPCNTAHYWYDALAAHSRAPVLHIADATVAALPRQGRGTVGLIATDGTVRAGIYHGRFAAHGVDTVDLADLGDASPVMRGIRQVKAGDVAAAREELHAAGARLVDRGAQTLVVGCTDASFALRTTDAVAGAPLVDAADCLARASIIKATGGDHTWRPQVPGTSNS